MPPTRNPLTQLWRWAKDQLIRDVPTDSGLCEFDCRKEQCTSGEWELCDRRAHRAAGELMPADQQSGRIAIGTDQPAMPSAQDLAAAPPAVLHAGKRSDVNSESTAPLQR